MNSAKEYLSQHLRETEQKSDIVYFIVIVMSIVLSILGGLNLASSYNDALAIQAQEAEMRSFVTSYNQKLEELNKKPFRAINSEDLDETQSNLIFAVQSNKLVLSSLRNLSLQEDVDKEHGKSFEMTVIGSWADTVAFLEGFGTKDALVSMRNIRMLPEPDDRVKTTLIYKIYLK